MRDGMADHGAGNTTKSSDAGHTKSAKNKAHFLNTFITFVNTTKRKK